MIHKDNADAQAELLRKRNFPAFVSRRGMDRFYRVVVGPFDAAASMSKVKEDLGKQNFDAIRMRWNPSAQQQVVCAAQNSLQLGSLTDARDNHSLDIYIHAYFEPLGRRNC
jgi:hypothetical protein